jgi:hypothetical protein
MVSKPCGTECTEVLENENRSHPPYPYSFQRLPGCGVAEKERFAGKIASFNGDPGWLPRIGPSLPLSGLQ